MRAYRMAKEEVIYSWLSHVKSVITQFYAIQGTPFNDAKLFQVRHPEALWANLGIDTKQSFV